MRISDSISNLGSEGLQEVLFLVFLALGTILSVMTFLRNLSVIPILGVLFCAYLLIEIPAISWMYFFAWMAVGLSIYFFYGRKKSRLAINKT